MASERTNWVHIAHEATRPPHEGGPSQADGAELEARVLADETDVDARVRLVGFYFLRRGPEHHQRRAEHLLWLAKHRPDIGLVGFGYIEEAQAPDGHDATRRAWAAAATAPDADIQTLANAASFLGFNRPEVPGADHDDDIELARQLVEHLGPSELAPSRSRMRKSSVS